MECSIIRKKSTSLKKLTYEGAFGVFIPMNESEVKRVIEPEIGDMEMITVEG